MSYRVKEIFYTLQGEGTHVGRPAVFCRFSGCNLWTGQERHRHLAICNFCDTDFVGTDGAGGGRFDTPGDLANAVAAAWAGATHPASAPYVVCTGGEPLLQLDEPAVTALHKAGFSVGVETNGTRPAPPGLDWICVSPKAGAPMVLLGGDELKLIFPQEGAPPRRSRTWTSPGCCCSPWTDLNETRTPGWRSSTAWLTPSGGSVCRPTSTSASRDGHLPGVHLRSRSPPPPPA